MSLQTIARDALMPRAPSGAGRGIGLSVLVHACLLVAIAFGVNWRSRTPEAQQAELWAAVPQAAAPRAIEPVPVVVEPKPAAPTIKNKASATETSSGTALHTNLPSRIRIPCRLRLGRIRAA